MKLKLLIDAQNELDSLRIIESDLLHKCKKHPKGNLHVMTKNQRYNMYYEYDAAKRDKYPRGKYINKRNQSKANALAQKEYEILLLQNIRRRIFALETLLSEYAQTGESSVMNKIHPSKLNLITSYEESDESFIEKWYAKTPAYQSNYPFANEFETNRGELVRSKSEKIIADALYANNVPYVYESIVHFSNGLLATPDFKVLNVSFRKEYVWEHFGMLGDREYSTNFNAKMNSYLLTNYWPGENFLFTTESQRDPLNISIVNSIIQKYLL